MDWSEEIRGHYVSEVPLDLTAAVPAIVKGVFETVSVGRYVNDEYGWAFRLSHGAVFITTTHKDSTVGVLTRTEHNFRRSYYFGCPGCVSRIIRKLLEEFEVPEIPEYVFAKNNARNKIAPKTLSELDSARHSAIARKDAFADAALSAINTLQSESMHGISESAEALISKAAVTYANASTADDWDNAVLSGTLSDFIAVNDPIGENAPQLFAQVLRAIIESGGATFTAGGSKAMTDFLNSYIMRGVIGYAPDANSMRAFMTTEGENENGRQADAQGPSARHQR